MNYKNKFEEIKDNGARKRGFEFEKLINKICDDTGILISKSYKTADHAQQIDGAIEIKSKIFLIEAKWEESGTLAASKLYSFLGKINSKIEGTLGIFISYNQLSDNFISAVRNGLRQNCIIIHGEDNIKDIINQNVNIKDFIWYVYQQASTKNRSFVNTSEFQSLPQSEIVDGRTIQKDNWDEISQMLLDSSLPDVFTLKLENNYSKKIELSKKTLNLISLIKSDTLRQEKYQILVKKCLIEEKDTFQTNLIDKLKSTYWKEYVKYSFLDEVKDSIKKIENKDKDIILDNAIEHIEKYLESFDEENYASALVDFLYKHLNDRDLEKLANAYLVIYCDDYRKIKFLQKQIANRIFTSLSRKHKDIFTVVKPTILNYLEQYKRDEFLFEEEKELELFKKNSINRLYRKFNKVLKESDLKTIYQEYDKL